ncbi:hypothetical protein Glove_164g64 [Diversispora epigaea]|uniref:RNA-polymerase II-associated protein 3-like C-terminal domain-containing protein n=1 Tax=Diversispora epigaea TaxID=1348612 RepID=A0A397IR86_9GLOM|nr:hypothetical protein Glove_164g64 [Diversispora epigaea]
MVSSRGDQRITKSYTDAVYDLSKAIVIDSKNCLALKCRAYCYYMLREYEEALCDLKVVIILGCADESTYINKINIMNELKNLNNSTQRDLVDMGAPSSVNDSSYVNKIKNSSDNNFIDPIKKKKKRVETEPNNMGDSMIEENNNYSQPDNEIIPIIDLYNNNNNDDDVDENNNGTNNKLYSYAIKEFIDICRQYPSIVNYIIFIKGVSDQGVSLRNDSESIICIS